METKTTESREARRKRILERGSDRLALITGRVDNLPSSPTTSSQPHHSLHAVSLPASSYNQDQDSQPPTKAPQDGNEMPRSETSNGSIRSVSLAGRRLETQLGKRDIHFDTTRTPALDTPATRTPALDTPATRTPALDINKTVQAPQVPPTARGPSSLHRANPFAVKRISTSISATENTRIRSSITIALLVVLSHLRIPILSSSIIRTIIATRPVFLVLLTDVTILLARLVFEKQVVSGTTDNERKNANSEGLGINLETGLLLYKAISAAFMDCSVYLVVVICGLSLLRGWF